MESTGGVQQVPFLCVVMVKIEIENGLMRVIKKMNVKASEKKKRLIQG